MPIRKLLEAAAALHCVKKKLRSKLPLRRPRPSHLYAFLNDVTHQGKSTSSVSPLLCSDERLLSFSVDESSRVTVDELFPSTRSVTDYSDRCHDHKRFSDLTSVADVVSESSSCVEPCSVVGDQSAEVIGNRKLVGLTTIRCPAASDFDVTSQEQPLQPQCSVHHLSPERFSELKSTENDDDGGVSVVDDGGLVSPIGLDWSSSEQEADFSPSVYLDSGTDFSERSVEDTPSLTYSYLLQYRLAFQKSSSPPSAENVPCHHDDSTAQSAKKELQKETMFLAVRFLSNGNFKNKRNGLNYSYDSSMKNVTDLASMKITECVSSHQNEQLTVEPSTSLRFDRPSSEARLVSQLQGSSGNGYLLGPQKTRLVPSVSSIVEEIKKLLVHKEKSIQDYCSSHKILLVGEGDFSFSACLAKALGSAENMIATSLNSEEYIRRYYSNAMINISYLKIRGCQVLHEVDATDLSNHTSITGLSFDRIVYNFPHCGDFSGTANSRRKNQNLVRGFMKQSAKLIKEDGEIHIRHKSNRFFRSWDLRKLASQAGLVLVDEAPFDPALFSGYNTKYGFEGGTFCSDYNFNCHPSCTYKFVLNQ